MFGLDRVVATRRVADAAQAEFLEAAHKYDVSGEWRDDGFGSCATACVTAVTSPPAPRTPR